VSRFASWDKRQGAYDVSQNEILARILHALLISYYSEISKEVLLT
jgi:hypothetical protein